MKKILLRSILISSSIIILSCTNASESDLIDQQPNTLVTYNGTIKQIIANNCLNCHSSPPQNGAPISFTSFNQVKNNIDKIIDRTNNLTAPMPPSGLIPQQLRNQIQQWKIDGLPEN